MKAFFLRKIVLTLVASVGLAGAAAAHHSSAQYDKSQVLTLKGTVKTFQWTNPHVVLWVMVPVDGGEPQQWAVETTSPGVLTRSGWTHNSIKAGDRVSIACHPLRDGSHGAGLDSVTLVDTGQKLTGGFAAQEKPHVQ